jgi:hypothetical protein
MKHPLRLLSFLLLASTVAACASPAGGNSATAPDTAKAEKKIGFAIGQEPGSFTITSQREAEAPGGTVRTDYAVSTRQGAKYSCYIMEPSRFGKVMSWGMASGSDAVCNEMSGAGKADSGTAKQSKPVCNDLLRAAGKCK